MFNTKSGSVGWEKKNKPPFLSQPAILDLYFLQKQEGGERNFSSFSKTKEQSPHAPFTLFSPLLHKCYEQILFTDLYRDSQVFYHVSNCSEKVVTDFVWLILFCN